jgi:hypothetical protein
VEDSCEQVGKFLSSCATGSFSGRAQLHGVRYKYYLVKDIVSAGRECCVLRAYLQYLDPENVW